MKIARFFAGLLGAVILATSGSVVAKEITSGGGGGGGGAVVCSAVKSLTAKGDARVGETGLASIDLNWSVKPCNPGQAVRVVATITNRTSKEVVYLDVDAALSSKVTVFVASRQVYNCAISIVDAVTGLVLETKTVSVSTIPKGGV